MISVTYDHQAFAWQHVGGISRYIYELAKRIGDLAGFKTRVIAPLHFNSYLREGGVATFGVYVPPIRRTGNIIRQINTLASPLLCGVGTLDIIHETYYSKRPSTFRSIPKVITVYDMIHEKLSHFFRDDDPTADCKRVAVARADLVICISENTRRDVVEILNVPISKTRVIYLGYGNARSENEQALPSCLAKPFILYVGHRGGWKNFKHLLTAYSSSPFLREEMLLVAFGGGPLGAGEVKRITALGLRENTVIQVSGDDDLLAALYRKASVFVYPSLYEGFGIPPLEAMNLDCPVTCSNTSSIPEVVGSAARGFDPTSIDEMRSAIEEVIQNSDLRRSLIEKGRERIRQFSWDRCAEETALLYRALAT